MSAHRRVRTRRVRSYLTAVSLALASGAGMIALAGPASAATTWYVATTGTDNAACGTAVGTPCKTAAYTIAKAAFAAGDTVNVAPGVYSPLTINGVTGKSATIVGGGSGVIFDGGGNSWAIAVNAAGVTIDLQNLTLRNGGYVLGGALPLVAGTVHAHNVDVSGSKGALGAVTVYQGTTLTWDGGTFSGNTSTATAVAYGAGAALYVVGRVTGQSPVAAGSATISDVTFKNNVANGATYASGGNGGAVFNAGTTVIRDSTFTGNQAVASTSSASARRGQGGAAFNGAQDADDAPALTIRDSSITAGSVTGAHASYGGALANSESILGGPVPSLTVSGVDVDGTTANLGGAVFNGGSTTWTGGSIANSTAYSGGAVYNSPTTSAQNANTVATFDGTAFTGNTANGQAVANTGNGGAIFNTATATVANAVFTGNDADASTAGSLASGYGGAIWNGAYATAFQPSLTVSDTEITDGKATIAGAIANAGNVYGVSGSPQATLTASGLVVHDNQALAGGALYSGGRATLTGGRIAHNQATHAGVGYGGGIYVVRSGSDPTPVVTLDGVAVADNTATVLGGGVAALGRSEVRLVGGTGVDDNSSGVSGGGVYNAGTLSVDHSSVSGNQAAFQGAGIYNASNTATDSPSVTLTDAAVDDNTAANAGGGVLTAGANTSFSVDGGHLDGNTAYAGGAVFVGDSAAATFDGTTMNDNTATVLGGAALANAGQSTVTSSSLTNNHALHTTGTTGLGGAIYSGTNTAGATTQLTVRRSLIAGNDAYAASAVITYSPGSGATNTTRIDATTITGNTSSSTIGAIEQLHPMTITASTITGNTAATNGNGALSLYAPASTSVSGSIVADNSGNDCSAAPTDGGYNLAAPGDTSCGFSTAKHDVLAAPQLGGLADNGGPTQSLLPGPASPALDRIPAGTTTGVVDVVTGDPVTLCGSGALDQRGTARPQGARCDIGAIEADQTAPTVSGPAEATYAVGNEGAPVSFTSTGSPRATLSIDGSLPAGVTFTDNGDGTATIAGTPAAHTGGAYDVTVKATNEAGIGSTAFTLRVKQAPVLSGPAAATYRVGQAGDPVTFTQAEGHPDATITLEGDLPDGVTFDGGEGSGTLHGTPAPGTGGEYPTTVRASNGTTPDATLAFTLTVEEGSGLTGPATSTFLAGHAGSSEQFVATGFPAPTLSATGLPAGLSLSGTGHAAITGTPAAGTGGEYDVVVTASNGVGPDVTTTTHVVVDEAPALSGPESATFVVGDYGQIGYGAVGYPEATVSITGTLPTGLSFTGGAGGGVIKGTPAAGTEGSYEITVRAHNGADADSVIHLTLEVAPTVSISTTSLPAATVGVGYGAQVSATGGQPGYSFTLAGGSLPAGLSLASTGQITGTPTGPAGTSTFTVKVTDSATGHHTATKQLSITVGKGTTTIVAEPLLLKTSTLTFSTITVVKAQLTGGSPAVGVGGQTILFKAGNATICTAVTAADGKVSCQLNLIGTLQAVANNGFTATFAGNDRWLGTSGSAQIIQP